MSIAVSDGRCRCDGTDKRVPLRVLSKYRLLFWIFMFSSVLGVLIETLWWLITQKSFQSRVGVIFGPFNPVYGFGAVLLTVTLRKLADRNAVWIAVSSAALGGVFEYVCSLIQEIVFGTVSWEYSHSNYNVGGRTNLKYMFFWGILGLLYIKTIYPVFLRVIGRLPEKTGGWLTVAASILMAFNLIFSSVAVYRQSERRKEIPAVNVVDRFFDKYYDDEKLGQLFPNMMSSDEISTRRGIGG